MAFEPAAVESGTSGSIEAIWAGSVSAVTGRASGAGAEDDPCTQRPRRDGCHATSSPALSCSVDHLQTFRGMTVQYGRSISPVDIRASLQRTEPGILRRDETLEFIGQPTERMLCGDTGDVEAQP